MLLLLMITIQFHRFFAESYFDAGVFCNDVVNKIIADIGKEILGT